MIDEGEGRVRTTYGANYERLANIKKIYDPTNLFSVDQNIMPAGSSRRLSPGLFIVIAHLPV